MGGITQKELGKPYFHSDFFWERKYQKKAKNFKVTNIKNKQSK